MRRLKLTIATIGQENIVAAAVVFIRPRAYRSP